MPKVTLDPWGDKAREILRTGEFRAHMVPERVAKLIGVCPSTYYKYRKDPGRMSLETVRLLREPLRLTEDELMSLVGG